ncbi:hypothetical protein [Streptococcus orisasini]|uniref:hypothetical protein n=1 Tax=Streptococcus orisasini TaxID=1080071 RepID=UPI00187CE949|nr:hypothetical protein [Streptococcus orisasini]
MVDIDDILTTDKNLKKLKPRQQERLKEEFPNKIPISTVVINHFVQKWLGNREKLNFM